MQHNRTKSPANTKTNTLSVLDNILASASKLERNTSLSDKQSKRVYRPQTSPVRARSPDDSGKRFDNYVKNYRKSGDFNVKNYLEVILDEIKKTNNVPSIPNDIPRLSVKDKHCLEFIKNCILNHSITPKELFFNYVITPYGENPMRDEIIMTEFSDILKDYKKFLKSWPSSREQIDQLDSYKRTEIVPKNPLYEWFSTGKKNDFEKYLTHLENCIKRGQFNDPKIVELKKIGWEDLSKITTYVMDMHMYFISSIRENVIYFVSYLRTISFMLILCKLFGKEIPQITCTGKIGTFVYNHVVNVYNDIRIKKDHRSNDYKSDDELSSYLYEIVTGENLEFFDKFFGYTGEMKINFLKSLVDYESFLKFWSTNYRQLKTMNLENFVTTIPKNPLHKWFHYESNNEYKRDFGHFLSDLEAGLRSKYEFRQNADVKKIGWENISKISVYIIQMHLLLMKYVKDEYNQREFFLSLMQTIHFMKVSAEIFGKEIPEIDYSDLYSLGIYKYARKLYIKQSTYEGVNVRWDNSLDEFMYRNARYNKNFYGKFFSYYSKDDDE